jgi:ketosteroid isomerase-like protein
MPRSCSDCGCLVESGVRIAMCDRPNCCCTALPAGVALEGMAAALRDAFESRDLTRFGALLADEARWGEDDAPNQCRSRTEVVATFQRLIDDGVGGHIMDLQTGPAGILLHLRIHWPDRSSRAGRDEVFHLYRVHDGRIIEIRPYDDREAAERALSAI